MIFTAFNTVPFGFVIAHQARQGLDAGYRVRFFLLLVGLIICLAMDRMTFSTILSARPAPPIFPRKRQDRLEQTAAATFLRRNHLPNYRISED